MAVKSSNSSNSNSTTRKRSSSTNNSRVKKESESTNEKVKKNKTVQKNNRSVKQKDKKLDATMRIRIDKERIDDFETIDTSFLDGKLGKKVKNNKLTKKKLIEKQKKRNANLVIFKQIIFIIVFTFIIALGILYAMENQDKNAKKKIGVNSETEKISEEDNEKVIDDNYLFVGDFYTDKFDFEELDYHYVKSSKNDLTTEGLLEDMNEKIYKYNPSIVFIQLGIVDLDKEKSISDIEKNFLKIIEGIKENRPYAKIYIESLYPINKNVDGYNDNIINKDIDNEKIMELNKKIEVIAEENEVNYLDLFELLNVADELKEEYTDDGVNLNKEGYSVILKRINKIIG